MTLLDLETRLVENLIADDVLAGNVSTRLPRNLQEALPWGTLQRVPGSRYIDTNTKTLELVRLQLNTYAAKGADAAAFAAWGTLAAALELFEGTGLGPAGSSGPPDIFITEVDTTPPFWYPDPDTELAGYLGFVNLFARGYAHLP